MKGLHKLGDVLETITLWFLAISMGAMTVVVFAQVIARLTAGSIKWSEEFARYIMVYLTYVGASVGVKRKSHIAIEFINGKLPRKVEDGIDIVANILCLACCGVILYYGFNLVALTMPQKTPAMRIPMGIAYLSIVLGSALMIIHFITNTLDAIVDMVKGKQNLEVAE